MAADDDWGTYPEPCLYCGGQVEYWYFGMDCHYNEPSSGIQCKQCQHRYSQEEWKVYAEVYNIEKEKNQSKGTGKIPEKT